MTLNSGDLARGSAFIGRRPLLDDLVGFVGDAGSFAARWIAGRRTQGRTSLLFALKDELLRCTYLQPGMPGRMRFDAWRREAGEGTVLLASYLDLRALTSEWMVAYTVAQSIEEVLGEHCGLTAMLDRISPQHDPVLKLTFELQKLGKQERLRIVFLLDEAEALVRPGATQEHRSGSRIEVGKLVPLLKPRVGYESRVVVCSTRSLAHLAGPDLRDVLLEMLPQEHAFIGNLDRQDVVAALERDLTVPPAEQQHLWAQSGGHPYLLRQFRSALAEHQTIGDLAPRLDTWFRADFAHLTRAEQAQLLCLAQQLAGTARTVQDATEFLEQHKVDFLQSNSMRSDEGLLYRAGYLALGPDGQERFDEGALEHFLRQIWGRKQRDVLVVALRRVTGAMGGPKGTVELTLDSAPGPAEVFNLGPQMYFFLWLLLQLSPSPIPICQADLTCAYRQAEWRDHLEPPSGELRPSHPLSAFRKQLEKSGRPGQLFAELMQPQKERYRIVLEDVKLEQVDPPFENQRWADQIVEEISAWGHARTQMDAFLASAASSSASVVVELGIVPLPTGPVRVRLSFCTEDNPESMLEMPNLDFPKRWRDVFHYLRDLGRTRPVTDRGYGDWRASNGRHGEIPGERPSALIYLLNSFGLPCGGKNWPKNLFFKPASADEWLLRGIGKVTLTGG